MMAERGGKRKYSSLTSSSSSPIAPPALHARILELEGIEQLAEESKVWIDQQFKSFQNNLQSNTVSTGNLVDAFCSMLTALLGKDGRLPLQSRVTCLADLMQEKQASYFNSKDIHHNDESPDVSPSSRMKAIPSLDDSFSGPDLLASLKGQYDHSDWKHVKYLICGRLELHLQDNGSLKLCDNSCKEGISVVLPFPLSHSTIDINSLVFVPEFSLVPVKRVRRSNGTCITPANSDASGYKDWLLVNEFSKTNRVCLEIHQALKVLIPSHLSLSLARSESISITPLDQLCEYDNKQLEIHLKGTIKAISYLFITDDQVYFFMELALDADEDSEDSEEVTVDIWCKDDKTKRTISLFYPFLKVGCKYVVTNLKWRIISNRYALFNKASTRFIFDSVVYSPPSMMCDATQQSLKVDGFKQECTVVNYQGVVSKFLGEGVIEIDQTLVVFLTNCCLFDVGKGIRVGNTLMLLNFLTIIVDDKLVGFAQYIRSQVNILQFTSTISTAVRIDMGQFFLLRLYQTTDYHTLYWMFDSISRIIRKMSAYFIVLIDRHLELKNVGEAMEDSDEDSCLVKLNYVETVDNNFNAIKFLQSYIARSANDESSTRDIECEFFNGDTSRLLSSTPQPLPRLLTICECFKLLNELYNSSLTAAKGMFQREIHSSELIPGCRVSLIGVLFTSQLTGQLLLKDATGSIEVCSSGLEPECVQGRKPYYRYCVLNSFQLVLEGCGDGEEAVQLAPSKDSHPLILWQSSVSSATEAVVLRIYIKAEFQPSPELPANQQNQQNQQESTFIHVLSKPCTKFEAGRFKATLEAVCLPSTTTTTASTSVDQVVRCELVCDSRVGFAAGLSQLQNDCCYVVRGMRFKSRHLTVNGKSCEYRSYRMSSNKADPLASISTLHPERHRAVIQALFTKAQQFQKPIMHMCDVYELCERSPAGVIESASFYCLLLSSELCANKFPKSSTAEMRFPEVYLKHVLLLKVRGVTTPQPLGIYFSLHQQLLPNGLVPGAVLKLRKVKLICKKQNNEVFSYYGVSNSSNTTEVEVLAPDTFQYVKNDLSSVEQTLISVMYLQPVRFCCLIASITKFVFFRIQWRCSQCDKQLDASDANGKPSCQLRCGKTSYCSYRLSGTADDGSGVASVTFEDDLAVRLLDLPKADRDTLERLSFPHGTLSTNFNDGTADSPVGIMASIVKRAHRTHPLRIYVKTYFTGDEAVLEDVYVNVSAQQQLLTQRHKQLMLDALDFAPLSFLKEADGLLSKLEAKFE